MFLQSEKCPSVADLLARGLAATALPDDLNAVGASPVETRVRLRLLHGVDHLLDLHHAMGEMLPSLVHQLVEPLRLRESKLSERKLNFVLARTLGLMAGHNTTTLHYVLKFVENI